MAKSKQLTLTPEPLPPAKDKSNPLWDALCKVFGLNPVTKSDCARIGKIVRDLKLKGAQPEQIFKARGRYVACWPKTTPTPEAILKHWDMLTRQAVQQTRPSAKETEYNEQQRKMEDARKAAEVEHSRHIAYWQSLKTETREAYLAKVKAEQSKMRFGTKNPAIIEQLAQAMAYREANQ